MNAHARSLTPTGLLGDFRLLLILFAAFRLTMLIVYQPLLLNGMERGVAAGGDFGTYFLLGGLTGEGLLPFRDWWSEFPPIPSYLITAIYSLLGAEPRYDSFAMLFGLCMLACDIGNLLLVRRIGSRVHSAATGIALAWVYAVMSAPAIFIWWNFEPLVTFWLLLALAWMVERRHLVSAAAAGIGALVKFTPALLIGVMWRYRKPAQALRYTLIAAAVFFGVYLLLFAQNAAMTMPSLTAQFGKASYQTVWALIDGNYRTGNFGPVEDRFDPARAGDVLGNPAVIPGIIRLAVAAALGLAIFYRVRRTDEQGLIAFLTLALLIFFLQAQGWSTQWLAQIIPLMLLALPTRDTVMALVLLSALSFVEYPFLFLRTGETGGVITGGLVTPFIALILARTLLLIALCIALYRRLRQTPIPDAA
jgi:hypothetical protein